MSRHQFCNLLVENFNFEHYGVNCVWLLVKLIFVDLIPNTVTFLYINLFDKFTIK
jgi:hypothetical protein